MQTSNSIPANGMISITFPYWNPQALGTIYLEFSYLTSPGSVVCVPNSGNPLISASTLPCSFDQGSQTLTLSGIFSQASPAGAIISFIIVGVNNPVSITPAGGILVSTLDSNLGVIDQGTGTLQATKPGLITGTVAKPDTTLVQSAATYRLEFVVPVPLSAGCIIQIVFPPEIVLGPLL